MEMGKKFTGCDRGRWDGMDLRRIVEGQGGSWICGRDGGYGVEWGAVRC